MHFQKLTGEKCYLSPVDENDFKLYAQWLNELELSKYLETFNEMVTPESEKNRSKNNANRHEYSIIELENNELIGNCCLFNIDHLNQTAETGIFIGSKNIWNKGFGKDALKLLLDYGFMALNLHNVSLQVYEYNEQAIKTYEKIGFKKTGIKREALYRNMKRHNIIYMDILAEEFYKR